MAATVEPKPPTSGGATYKAVKFRPLWAALAVLLVSVSAIVTTMQEPNPQPIKPSSERGLLEWLWYPIERNAGLRLPTTPNSLRSISFAGDGRRGLAVGAGGTILATGDGGQSWAAQDSGTSNTLWAVHYSGAGRLAWAVGTRGIILTTNDGGEHWVAQASGVEVGLNGVQFLEDGTRGWVVGDNSTILMTSNGGQTWERQLPVEGGTQAAPLSAPTKQALSPSAESVRRSDRIFDLFDLHIHTDGKNGWVVGGYGIILLTKDGGETWNSPQPPGGTTLSSVRFSSDGQFGIASGYKSVVSTTDGGANWARLDVPQVGADVANWFRVHLIDQRRIWLARADGAILSTKDGGITWTKQNTGISDRIRAIRFDAEGRRGWAVTHSGTILTSEDEGKSWTTRATANSSRLTAIHIDATGRRAWAIGPMGLILATNDGGNHWQAQQSSVAVTLAGVKFLDDNLHGWAVGARGTIIVTVDGGQHWAPLKSDTSLDLNSVHFHSDRQRGWVVGDDGLVLFTNDGGKSWQSQQLQASDPDWNSVYMDSQGESGWLVGTGGWAASTKDGGRTWQVAQLATNQELTEIKFDATGRLGIIVGVAGLLFTTEDGGNRWIEKHGRTNADLAGAHRSKDGRAIRLVGSGGIILSSLDGGSTWSRTDSKAGSRLLSVSFADDDKTGWAAGYSPSLLKTTNGGQSWEPIAWPLSNQRYPAPWFWLSLLPALFFLRMSVRQDRALAAQGVEAIAASDAPVSDFAADRLQFGPLARGISRFLRNANTQPPLTLAISGDWGSGKSTLMELVCADLRRYGTRPIWFNAWHHQKEEQLLAALLNAVRSKAIPPISSFDGLAFRMRLLLIRSKKHLAITFFVLLVAVAFVAYLATHSFAEWTSLWNDVNSLSSAITGSKGSSGATTGIGWKDAAHLLPQLLAGATALFSLYRGLKAFNIDPAVLLSTTAEKFKLSDAAAQTSFRSRFAEQFAEVTQALPNTMVIAIDDLDRCQPETVLTVMESVNFLVSSGKCFVMFGMATQRVQAALSLTFRKVANELQPLETAVVTKGVARLEAERARRLAYAHDYLEKLINLEIVVPDRADIPPHLLVEATTNQKAGALSTLIAQFAANWPGWVAATVVFAGILVGFAYTRSDDGKPESKKAAVVAETLPASVTPGPAGPQPTIQALLPEASLDAGRYIPVMQKPAQVSVDRLLVAGAVVMFAVIAAGLVLFWLRSLSNAVTDSAEYRDALRNWMPVVHCRRSTPRAIKRFGNRLRYLAMLRHDTKYDETGFDRMLQQLSALADRLRRREPAPAPAAAPTTGSTSIDEPQLVALASLQEVYGDDWQQHANAKIAGSGPVEAAIADAIQRSPSHWPPDERAIKAFGQLLKGIRIADAS